MTGTLRLVIDRETVIERLYLSAAHRRMIITHWLDLVPGPFEVTIQPF